MMKHHVTLNLLVEGNVPEALEVVRLLTNHIAPIGSIKLTGINLYKEFGGTEPATGAKTRPYEEEDPQEDE